MRRPLPPDAPPPASKWPYSLRKMRLEDLEPVMEIQRASFKSPWSLDLFKRELTHEWSTVLLAEDVGPAGEPFPVGFLIFWLVHDEVHILNVATAPAYRRKGVARCLIEASLDKGRRSGCALATLEVRRSNEAAIALYKSYDFRPVGVRPNYYSDEGEDAIVMVLDL